MPMGHTITLRVTIENPVPGVTYSLQDGKSVPVDPVVATEAPLSFDVPVRVAPGPKFLGESLCLYRHRRPSWRSHFALEPTRQSRHSRAAD
jgi:hypothetical protein